MLWRPAKSRESAKIQKVRCKSIFSDIVDNKNVYSTFNRYLFISEIQNISIEEEEEEIDSGSRVPGLWTKRWTFLTSKVVSVFVCSSQYLSACLDICLLVSVFVCSSQYLSDCIGICLLVSVLVCLSLYLSAWFCICLLFSDSQTQPKLNLTMLFIGEICEQPRGLPLHCGEGLGLLLQLWRILHGGDGQVSQVEI